VRKGPATVRVHPLLVESQPAGHAYVHYCETAPCARGRGVFPAVLSTIARDHATETVWTAVNSRNAASLKAMRKAGFVAGRRIKVRFLLGVRRVTAEAMEMQA
jgi:L-amino acid N-acyltransferase YncA